MRPNPSQKTRAALIWGALLFAVIVPVGAAAFSPYLAYRQPVYIAAGFSGIAAMGLLLVQPLLAADRLPGLAAPRSRRVHRWVGSALTLAVLLHVGGLWITSPPDVIDALTFTSPTPFSPFGVIAMWAVLASALWAVLRKRLGTSPRSWKRGHSFLATVIVLGTVAHVLLIEGTMETFSKWVLSLFVLVAGAQALRQTRPWTRNARPSAPLNR